MKKEPIYFDLQQLILLFKTELTDLVFLARTNDSVENFRTQLNAYISSLVTHFSSPEQYDASLRIFKMLKHEGMSLHDLSTDSDVECNTFASLWHLLREEKTNHVHPDFMIDIYFLFKQLYGEKSEQLNKKELLTQMKRWPTGLDKHIIEIREKNKERIIQLLIKKIENRKSIHNKYRFEPETSDEEKRKMVESWWNNSHFHLQMAIRDPKELNRFLGNTLSDETVKTLNTAKKKKNTVFHYPLLPLAFEHRERGI